MVRRSMYLLIPTLSPWLLCGVVLEFFYMLSLIFTVSLRMLACCSIDHMLTPTDIRLPRHSRSTSRSSSICSQGSGIFFRDVKSTTLYSLVMNGCCRQYQWHTWTSYISVWMQRRHFGS